MDCLCNVGTPQIYQPQCAEYLKKVTEIMPLQRVANDGTSNSIDLSVVPIPEATFLALFNNADASKRMHHISGIKNFEGTAGEAKVKTWNDDSTTKLSDGQDSITFVVQKTSPMLAGALKALECGASGVYLKTEAGQLIGYGNPSTIATEQKLYPIPVERWDVNTSVFTTDSEVAMTTITIYFPSSMVIGNMVVVSSDEHLLTANKNYEAKPAIVKAGTTPATTSSANVIVSRPSGGILGNSAPVSGLALTDFAVFNETTALAVVPLTAVESPAGDYILTFAPQTSADVVRVSLVGTSGYVSNTTVIAIP